MDEILLAEDGLEKLKIYKNDTHDLVSMAGCTANVVLIDGQKIYVANAGDSRSIMIRKDRTTIAMSVDHKPDLPEEKKRISNAGGYVSDGRVNENLNLSRAIGDMEYKRNADLSLKDQMITSYPDIKEYTITDEIQYILMGCDGIWELVPLDKMVDHIFDTYNDDK